MRHPPRPVSTVSTVCPVRPLGLEAHPPTDWPGPSPVRAGRTTLGASRREPGRRGARRQGGRAGDADHADRPRRRRSGRAESDLRAVHPGAAQRHASSFRPTAPDRRRATGSKIMAQGGTPPDFWEIHRAAFGDLLLLGIDRPHQRVRQSATRSRSSECSSRTTSTTSPSTARSYGWPIVISADALALQQGAVRRTGPPYPPVNTADTSWTMEKFLDLAQKLTRNDGQVFGFGGTRSGYDRLTDGTNWGQPPWDGQSKCMLDSPLWQQAEQFWVDCIYKQHVQPTAQEKPPPCAAERPVLLQWQNGDGRGLRRPAGEHPLQVGPGHDAVRRQGEERRRPAGPALAAHGPGWQAARTWSGRSSSGSGTRSTPAPSP